MLRSDGAVASHGWRSEAVKEALHLCLACKGCKGDCPVRVDMASYKAEFLAHYYAGRLRPPSAYAMGLIAYWARVAALIPGVANALLHAPGLAPALKRLAGIDPRRAVPRFAARTFRAWFRHRAARDGDGRPVLLWVDTFNDHFHPETAAAAKDVLEAAGFRVILSPAGLCCGRPLYDYGMLRLARRTLRGVVDALRPYIDDGVPVVGLEPSCVAVFRDELGNLLPDDAAARSLQRHVHTLAELLERYAPEWTPP
jgi:Fe-S oxidoreductase